jgi:hypothetical protein
MISTFPGPGIVPNSLPAHISRQIQSEMPALFLISSGVLRMERGLPAPLHLGQTIHAALQDFHLVRWLEPQQPQSESTFA